jgi:hypothetical protein
MWPASDPEEGSKHCNLQTFECCENLIFVRFFRSTQIFGTEFTLNPIILILGQDKIVICEFWCDYQSKDYMPKMTTIGHENLKFIF